MEWVGKRREKGKSGPGHKAACLHGKEFDSYPEGNGEPQQGSEEGGDTIRGTFSKNLSGCNVEGSTWGGKESKWTHS